jgi:hypothetical protein
VLSLCAALAACSNDDGDDACATSNGVDDEEVASTTQALSPSDQRGVARTIDGLLDSPPPDAAARSWSEAPRSAEHALVRDFVETLLIDADVEVASRFVGTAEALSPATRDRPAAVGGEARYTALRRLVVADDLVLARSEGERAGATRELYDLFRVSEGRVIERWSAERAPSSGSAAERLF